MVKDASLKIETLLDAVSDNELAKMAMLLKIKDTRLKFALDYHVNTRGDRMDFKTYPHIRKLYESSAKTIVLQGSVQSFKSEWSIIDHFAAAYCGLSIFYVLPKYEMRTTYVQNRVNRVVENVREYKKIIKESFFDSVAMKHFGKGTIKYVGSNVLADFTEFPADMLVVEELDECNKENLTYGLDRLRASPYQFKRYLANPRHKGQGINELFLESNMQEWSVPCVACGKYSFTDWFSTVVEEIRDRDGNVVDYRLRDTEWEEGCGRDIYLICPKCNGKLERSSTKGKWEAQADSPVEGFHISMLCNLINSVSGMWKRFRRGILDPAKMQQFYNSDLGQPYSAVGSKVTESLLENSVEIGHVFHIEGSCGHVRGDTHEGPCSMGVDVGSNLDVRVSYVTSQGKRRAVFIGKVKNLDELVDIIERYNVQVAVIDSMPEATLVADFQEVAPCDVWACSYRQSEGSDKRKRFDYNTQMVMIDRTAALDKSFAQLKRRRNLLPENYGPLLSGVYVEEMCLPVRELVEDSKGRQRYEWTKGIDHQRHADTYDALAAEMMLEDDIKISINV